VGTIFLDPKFDGELKNHSGGTVSPAVTKKIGKNTLKKLGFEVVPIFFDVVSIRMRL